MKFDTFVSVRKGQNALVNAKAFDKLRKQLFRATIWKMYELEFVRLRRARVLRFIEFVFEQLAITPRLETPCHL